MGDDLGHRGDGVRHVAIRHGWIERQGENPVRGVLGHRKLARLESEAFPVERLEVEGAEVDAHADILLLEGVEDLVARAGKLFGPEDHHVQVIGGPHRVENGEVADLRHRREG